MIKIVSFLPKYFDGAVDCYRFGFPEGHNRYTLARLARFQRDTMFVALDEHQDVVGVLIGMTSYNEAWFTALAVMPTVSYFQKCALLLSQAVANRFVDLGFTEARFTTRRRGVIKLAQRVKAVSMMEEPNYYFDGQNRYVVTVNTGNLPLLVKLIQQKS